MRRCTERALVCLGVLALAVSAAAQVVRAPARGLPHVRADGAACQPTDVVTQGANGIFYCAAPASSGQPADTDLTAIAALVSAADKCPYATGAGTWALADCTAAARTVWDDLTVAAMLATLGGAPLVSPTFTGVVTLPAGTVMKSSTDFMFHFSGGGGGGGSFENTAFGYKAGNALAGNGYANTLFGRGAGEALNGTEPNAHGNTMIGYNAGFSVTTGRFNTFVGTATANSQTTQSSNTFIGYHAGVNAKGTENLFVGYLTGTGNASSTGTDNVAIGSEAFRNFTTGSLNTAIGEATLSAVTSGARNIALGYAAGNNITTGSYNVAIGYNVQAQSATASNQLTLGNILFCTDVDGTGTTISSGNCGLGIAPGAAKFTIGGSIAAGLITTGSTPAVANVGANSCGTTAATIAGNDNSFEITVGATAGTQCRVTFTTTAPVRWNCDGNNDTTVANLVSAKSVSTTAVDFYGTFVAGDVITGQCLPR